MAEQILEQPQLRENKLSVTGIAIRSGISRNKIKYSEEELMKFAPTLQHRPILKDHNATVDNAVGLVTNSESPNGSIVQYQGWVKEDGTNILEKIKDGRIKEVSIGAIAGQLVKEEDDSEVMLAQDLTGLELSLTPVPGIVGTSISSRMERLIGKKPIFENVSLFKEIHGEEGKYECPECGNMFGSKEELKNHVRSHFEVKPKGTDEPKQVPYNKKSAENLDEQDNGPPKDWLDSCVDKVGDKADDPEALCGWIWKQKGG